MKNFSDLIARGATREEICDKHGAYTAVQLCGRIYSKCPQCTEHNEKIRLQEEKERAAEQYRAHYQRRMGEAAIAPRFQDCRLDNYRVNCAEQDHALQFALDFVDNYADIYKQSGKCALFLGRTGTGKTHLACAIVYDLIEQGFSAVYTSVSKMLRRIRSTYNIKKGETEAAAIDIFTAPDLLIIDEVGVQFGTEYERNMLFDIINARYEEKKNTILISNMPFQSQTSDDGEEIIGLFDYLGETTLLRLYEDGGEIIPFTWDNERRKIAQKSPKTRPFKTIAPTSA